MSASDTSPPLTDEEVQAIRALWADIRTARTEKTSIGEMVPVDVDLFDLKLGNVFADLEATRARLGAVVRALASTEVALVDARAELAMVADEAGVQCREAAARTVRAEKERDEARAELEAVATDRDVWKRNAIDAYLLAERRAAKRKAAPEDDMRRQIILREINQGALAGLGSEISESAADLVLKALNAYDAWASDTTHWKQDDATQEADRARAAAALGETGGTENG